MPRARRTFEGIAARVAADLFERKTLSSGRWLVSIAAILLVVGCGDGSSRGDGWSVSPGLDGETEAGSVVPFDGGGARDAVDSVNSDADTGGNLRLREFEISTGSLRCGITTEARGRCWGDRDEPIKGLAEYEVDDVSTSNLDACFVTDSKEVQCWESSSPRPTRPIESLAEEVGAGLDFGCVRTLDDRLECWGRDRSGYGHTDPPSGRFNSLAVTDKRGCAIGRAGSVECWGKENWGRTDDPPGTFRHIALGVRTNCGVRADKQVHCWGLGTDPNEEEHPRLDYDQGVPPAQPFWKVAVGTFHACGLKSDGAIVCWGVGSEPDRDAGRKDYDQGIPPPGTFQSISAAALSTCALTIGGIAVCWGGGFDGYERFAP